MRKILAVFLALSAAVSGYAIDLGGQSGGYMGEYLYSFGSSARSLALGGAGAGSNRDTSLSYYNPASVAESVNKEVTFFFAPIYNGTSFSYIGVGYPLSEGAVLGISRVALDVTGIDKTDATGNNNGTAAAGESAYLFTYGYKINQDISVGANLKIVSQALDNYSGIGYGIDLGVMFKAASFVNAGIMLQNAIQPVITLRNESEPFPVNLRAGAAFEVMPGKLYAYTDGMLMNIMPKAGVYANGYSFDFRWFGGAEYKLADNISARAGINYKEISAGMGYSTGDFDVDYAASFNSLGLSHRVSMTVRFGLLVSEQEKWVIEKEKEVNFKLWYGRAYKFFNEKKFKEAKDDLNQAIAILPDSAEAFDLLSQIESGEKEHAAEAVMEEAFALFEAGKATDAKAKMDDAKKLDDKIGVKLEEEYMKLADKLNYDKKYVEAMKYIGRVLFINPENPVAADLYQQLQSIMEFVK